MKNIEASGISDDNKREAANMYKVVGVTLGSAKNPEAREYVTKYLEIMPDDQDMAKYLTTLK